jgi:type I restriction enzyme M protein
MTRLTAELSELFDKGHALEAEIRKQLASIGYKIG